MNHSYRGVLYHSWVIEQLLLEYDHLFPDVPTRTNKIYHDVEIVNSKPVKQHPYRIKPLKQKCLKKKEIQNLLENDFIKPSKSVWSSTCIFVLNKFTKTDSFRLPRIDDCIDRTGNAKYVTKFDLLKGFCQIPLTVSAKNISAFVTRNGLYRYKVMPFGM
ncbi:hypothetical protein CHS0354_001095 [Potamilus streckersoni]|uniref:Reverse transcriptase domain-containing protein n=1 Tax=Potamilus streckersoni TaxID=2493646 RepID=A0AAE0RVL2_9BIVA|nr:hypothetical protein CHS0354_001095 [Potamilus streckersoni]